MLRGLGRRFEAFFRAVTPDPFVLAVGLTFVVFGAAMIVEGTSPLDVVRAWQGDAGFWGLLAFTMQMILILVTGHAVASSPPVEAAIARLARLPKSGGQAAALVCFVTMLAALQNWGLGLIVGALLAREVGRSMEARGLKAHYPLLVAAGYAGLLCWHGGLSGSAPLKMTTSADVERFLGEQLAATVEPLGFDQTVLTLPNLLISGGLVILIPLTCLLLAPADEDAVGYSEYRPDAEPAAEERPALSLWSAALVVPFGLFVLLEAVLVAEHHAPYIVFTCAFVLALLAWLAAKANPDTGEGLTVPERLERQPASLALLVFLLGAATFRWLHDVGIGQLDPNAVNLLFLTLGLALHGSLRRYVAALDEAVRGTTGLVLQYPFYAGIMGVMRTTGLAATVSSTMSAVAPASLYTTVTFLSAGLVNLFVPSGGGQWAVQGPIAVQAAEQLSLPVEQVVMAVAYGDQWTNMLQPFWALPLLAITGIKARDILGYTALFLLVGGAWMIGGLIVWAAY